MTGSWAERAACVGQPLGWFDRGAPVELLEKGLELCEQCPVRQQCLAEASSRDRYWTLRGGLLPTARKSAVTPPRKKSSRRTPACGTAGGYRRHVRSGEEACRPCVEAERLEWRLESKRRRQGGAAQEGAAAQEIHGTSGGYARHLRSGEEPCDSCRAARREVDRAAYARRKARRDAVTTVVLFDESEPVT